MRKIFVGLLLLLFPVIVSARSGCCSWHGGVSHCDTSTGRQVCNDGSYSPSCGCQKVAPVPPKQTERVVPIKPSPTVANIQNEINAVKSKYFANHDGFRERLIDQITDYLGADKNQVASEVYQSLPDVK